MYLYDDCAYKEANHDCVERANRDDDMLVIICFVCEKSSAQEKAGGVKLRRLGKVVDRRQMVLKFVSMSEYSIICPGTCECIVWYKNSKDGRIILK